MFDTVLNVMMMCLSWSRVKVQLGLTSRAILIMKSMKTCNISRIFSLVSMTVRSILSILSLPPLCPSSTSPAPLWPEPPNMDCFLLRTMVDIIWPIPWMERFTFLPVDGGMEAREASSHD